MNYGTLKIDYNSDEKIFFYKLLRAYRLKFTDLNRHKLTITI